MDFETIINAIENGEVEFTSMDIINIAAASATINDEHINCDTLAEIIKGIQGVKKTAGEDWKEYKKEVEKAEDEKIGAKAKAWFDTLEVGTEISWKTSKGIVTGTKGSQKADAKKAHVLLKEIPETSTAKDPKPDRHIKFSALIYEEV